MVKDKFLILKKRGLIHQESKIITTGLVYDSEPRTTSDSYFQQLSEFVLQKRLRPVISSELQESINIGLTSTGRTCIGICSSLGLYGAYSKEASQSSELVILDAVVSLSRLLNIIYTTFVHEQRSPSQPSTPRSGSRQAKSRLTKKEKKMEEPEEVQSPTTLKEQFCNTVDISYDYLLGDDKLANLLNQVIRVAQTTQEYKEHSKTLFGLKEFRSFLNFQHSDLGDEVLSDLYDISKQQQTEEVGTVFENISGSGIL